MSVAQTAPKRLRSSALSAAETRPSTTTQPSQIPARPRLKLLSFELPKAKMPFSMLCIGILLAGLVAVLLLSIYVSNTSYQIDQLSTERDQLAEQKDALAEDNSYRASPQNIAIAAEKMGLVRDTSPEFLDPKTGKVIDAPPIKESGDKKAAVVPGPRADTRDDLRPNLRSDEKLPVVGGSPSKDIAPPAQKQPE